MKKVLVSGIVIFMYSFGIVIAIDLIMVLNGHFIQRSYPEYGMAWHDSPILHYNISRMANVAIGAISFMALFGGTMYLWLVLLPLFRETEQSRRDVLIEQARLRQIYNRQMEAKKEYERRNKS